MELGQAQEQGPNLLVRNLLQSSSNGPAWENERAESAEVKT